MYAKIFRQIFDSSIADNPQVRYMFMDLLILADSDGVVDMTHEAIAARTRRKIEEIQEAIGILESPDPKSRTKTEEGRRLIKLDPDRDWGWQIVNYQHYRNMKCEESRKSYMRKYMRNYRANNVNSNSLQEFTSINMVNTSPSPSSLQEKRSGEKPKSIYNLNVQRQVLIERIQKLKNLSPISESDQQEVREEIRELKAKLKDIEKTICQQ